MVVCAMILSSTVASATRILEERETARTSLTWIKGSRCGINSQRTSTAGCVGILIRYSTDYANTHTSACHFAPVDHASIARACGCGATTVTAPGDLGLGSRLRAGSEAALVDRG